MKIIIAAFIILIAYEFYVEVKKRKERERQKAFIEKLYADMEREIEEYLSSFDKESDDHADD